MNESEYHNLLLTEYAEAGSQCRNCEQLIRTSISVSVPILLALIGLLLSPLQGHLLKLGLSIAGFLVCLIFLNTIYREKAYYHYYLNRAKEIEKLIVINENQIISVYTNGAGVTEKSWTMSNKNALAAVLGIALLYFVASIIFYCLAAFHVGHAGTSPPTVSYVPDEETAIQIAVTVWTRIFGKEKIQNEKPFKAILQNGIWHVRGSLPKGWKGGVAEADIAKDDGRIIQIYHGK